MSLQEFVRAVSSARGWHRASQMIEGLHVAGVQVTPASVYWWWDGTTKRLDPASARALATALALSPAELDMLRDVQAGFSADTSTR